MCISKLNAERYSDPTAYEALTNIRKEEKAARVYRPLVYICSPYSGDIAANVEAARRYSRFAVDRMAIPITPHLLYPQFLNDSDPAERELGMSFGNVLMSKCSQLWVFGEKTTEGMVREIARARRKGITVRYFSEALEEVRN